MKGFLFRLVITGLGLWAAETIVPGVQIDGWGNLVVAALLLGIVNAVIRPIILILTLPLTVLTLGLLILVVNGISDRRVGQSRSRGAAARYRERRDSPDHPHPHPAAHGPHLGALHPGGERDFGCPGGLAHAGVLAHRAVGRDPHVDRCGADELARLRVRRRLRPDRALPPHRSDGPPARLNERRRVVEVGGGWWRLTP